MAALLHLSLWALALAMVDASEAKAQVAWQTGSVEASLDSSAKERRQTLVYFTAAWCPTCQDLERELLNTAAGRGATAPFTAVKVDVDAEGGQALVERFVILAYPSALVLNPDGEELGRVVGYEGQGTWTSRLHKISQSTQTLERLKSEALGSPNSARAALNLARAKLERGQAEEGISSLQALTLRWPKDDASAESLWTLGRYYHRVKGQHETAQHLWRELGERFYGTSWAPSAWAWFGKAQKALGRLEAGASMLRQVALRDPSQGVYIRVYASYVAKHSLRGHFQEARTLLSQALRRLKGPSAERERVRLSALLDKLQ